MKKQDDKENKIKSMVLVFVRSSSGIVHEIKVLDNNGNVYSILHEFICVYGEDILQKAINNNVGKYKVCKWDSSWYCYLLSHLSKIKNFSSYKYLEYDNPPGGEWGGEWNEIYFIIGGRLKHLGAYGDGLIYMVLDDKEAVNILAGLQRNETLFWRGKQEESYSEWI